jgi:parallel beta-helix repeat protein
LVLEPGVTVKFGKDVYIEVFGAFKAQGTPDQQVVLTSIKDDASGGDTNGDGESSVPGPGDWTMIRFKDSSNDANCVVSHSVIKFAGEHRGDRFGAIHLESASPTIRDNTLTGNRWYAISADVNSFPTVEKNRLTDNVGNGLEIRAGTMILGGTWANTDIAYIVAGAVTIRNPATLTMAPGVIVKFTENAHINVHGTLRTMGTAEKKVVLTSFKDDSFLGDSNADQGSSAPAPGDWTTVRFYDDSNDASCVIDHALIKYAGKYNRDRYGAIHVQSASPTISNSTITDSFFYGIWYDAGSAPTLSGNTFGGNIQGDVFQEQ